MEINSKNVGRIAERIAMNELEARGFHIIDLAYMSKTTANVDFIASKNGKSFNVQVKGASNPFGPPRRRWTVGYGQCNEETIEGRSSFFNAKSDFALRADVIVLIAVNSPSNYCAVVMPVDEAEKAVQLNMTGFFRQPKRDGGKHAPGRMWSDLEPSPRARAQNPYKDKERAILRSYQDAWDSLGGL